MTLLVTLALPAVNPIFNDPWTAEGRLPSAHELEGDTTGVRAPPYSNLLNILPHTAEKTALLICNVVASFWNAAMLSQ